MRIIIVDDHEVVREGLQSTLADDPHITVVGSASSSADALELTRRTVPDCAIVDLRLPDMPGDQLCRKLLEIAPSMRVIVLSTYLSEEAVRSSLEAGAHAYVTKAAGLVQLRKAIEDLWVDGSRMQEHEAPQIVHQLHTLVAEREGQLRVTPQQERVLELAAQGLTNKQVGERIFISESTVRFHIQKLKDTFEARTRTELVAKAIRSGLIAQGPEDDSRLN